jgi:hypothetical protein
MFNSVNSKNVVWQYDSIVKHCVKINICDLLCFVNAFREHAILHCKTLHLAYIFHRKRKNILSSAKING